MINLETMQERVKITAYFQGKKEHKRLPLSLGRVILKLPESNTNITLLLPNEPIHERFEPLKFCVRKEGDLRDQHLERIQLTADKAKNFAMSVYIFEPGPNAGPKVLKQDGTIWQQPTVTRSEDKVPVNRPMQIEPGAHYRLEIYSIDGCSAEAHLVKVEESIQKSNGLGYDSQLFQTVSPSIIGLLRLKVMEAKMRAMINPSQARNITFKSDFNEDLAKRSILSALNKLHSEQRSELEKICEKAKATGNIPLGEKALGRFLLALDRTDIGQLLQDQLEAAVGKDQYLTLLGIVYNDVHVRFIDIIVNNAKKYVSVK